MRLMVLGLVSSLQPVHGHDIRRGLLAYDGRPAMSVPAGSVYHALRKLTQEGLLEPVETERNGGRPERTTYRTTPAGVREFRVLLRRYWWQYQLPSDPFLSALSFLPSLPRAEAVRALRTRAGILWSFAEQQRRDLDDGAVCRPEHVDWQLERALRWFECEADWCVEIADRIEDGMGVHDADLPQHAPAVLGEAAPDTLEGTRAGHDPRPRPSPTAGNRATAPA
ncbi:PadR family transcriptional regulator [Dactylosporangium sp. NPDC005555]|uniref:PadR family transcriptional regulator n=1 Tax=Dactylosporangium sp. NPDC005555 TaxID=3154889 RepID=UPI0033AA1840